MKHAKILLVSLVALLVLAFAGCGIKFDINFVVDGEIYETIRTGQNELIEIPTSPTKENYTFDGWYWDKDVWQKPFTANSLLDAPISDNMNVYAKWVGNTIRLNLDPSGGSLVLDYLNVKYGEKIGALPTPTKPNYTFNGWVDKDGNPVTGDTVVTNDMTCITATWKINTYTVTFDLNNGEDAVIKEVKHGEKLSAPFVANPKHTLIGWYNGETQWNFSTDTVKENMTLVAKWEPFIFDVTFDAEGGELSQNTLNATHGSKIGTLPIPERLGYVFIGWYEKSDTNYENKIDESTVVTDNMELVAKWEIDDTKIAIFFDANGGTVEKETVYIDKGASLGIKLVDPVRNDGAIFLGWYNGTEKVSRTTTFNNDVVLVAKWVESVICTVSGTYDHDWTSFDYSEAAPTCTEDGKAVRYCKDCGFKQEIPGDPKLGHDYVGAEWEIDAENPLKQSRRCNRCLRYQTVTYTNLSASIKDTTVTGDIYGANNIGCLYNGNWTETTGTFCGKNGSPLTVTIELLEPTQVDYIFVKGTGNLVFSLKVKYAGDTEYTILTSNATFGYLRRIEIGGEITEAVFETSNGGNGTWYWQEIALAQEPKL